MSDINKETFKLLFRQLRDQKLHQYRTQLAIQVNNGDQFDRAMSERNQALMIKLKARTNIFLKKIEKSLKKLDEGTFGTCEECEGDISMERLMARPTASLCIHCKEEQELNESNILYSKRSHTLGQDMVVNNGPDGAIIGIEGGGIESITHGDFAKIVNL